MYAARRTGHKKEMFGYVRGGYPRILQTLADTLEERGVELLTDAPVSEATATADGRVAVKLADGSTMHFDEVAFTTPSSVIARAVPGLSDDERARHQGVDYLGIVCASLLLRKPITEYYVTNITDGWVPLTAVIEMTTIVDPEELGGRYLVYLPKYCPADDKLFDRTDDELREEWLSALEKMHPHFSRADVVAMRFSRVRSVMALPTLNYSERLPPMKTSVPACGRQLGPHPQRQPQRQRNDPSRRRSPHRPPRRSSGLKSINHRGTESTEESTERSKCRRGLQTPITASWTNTAWCA